MVKKSYYTPLLVVLLVAASFYIGRLSAQVDKLKGGVAGTETAESAGTVQPAGGTRSLDVAGLKARAKKLGLNTDQFDKCLDEGKMAKQVSDEQAGGAELGVSGTPSFLINGVLLVGAQPQSSFESVIEAELKNGTGDKAAAALGENGKRMGMKYGIGYMMGEKNAKIKIVEYSDFECPFCERAYPTVKALMEKYKGKISLEYRQFPLSFHPNAQKTAEASLCAGEQGKFWEMHDDLFTPGQ